MKNEKIDFVVLWVDDGDKEWKKKKQKYNPEHNTDSNEGRYRDWGLFKYWFRGIEKFAPWVNNIFLVTDHQIPEWLNLDNSKLIIVNHEDYIDKKYLPIFNSNALECTINRIPNLSDKFVLFNDDTFLINKTKPKDFFKNGLPVSTFIETAIVPNNENPVFVRTLVLNTEIVNSIGDKRKFIKAHPFRYINPKYGISALRTLSSISYKSFIGFYNPHLPEPFLKKSFEKVQTQYPQLFEKTLSHRFRSSQDITQYLVRYYQLVTANFYPRSCSYGKNYAITEKDLDRVVKHVLKQKTKTICINDTGLYENFDKCKNELLNVFEKVLPEKSSFEKRT